MMYCCVDFYLPQQFPGWQRSSIVEFIHSAYGEFDIKITLDLTWLSA